MNTIEENVRRNQKVFYKTKCLPSGKDYNDGQYLHTNLCKYGIEKTRRLAKAGKEIREKYEKKYGKSFNNLNSQQQEKILQEIEELENSINGKKNKGMDLQTILIVGAVAVAIYFFFIKK